MITVSVCMIVKNEEKNLRRCLDCLKDFADEIIIADTGSIDRTKEIARKYTDKIYDFEWIDDFAAARNFVFSKATMDYIYSADADEMLDKANIYKLMQLKQVLLDEIDIVQMNYTNQLEYGTTYNYDKEPRPKLFKRVRSFMWQDPVHETIRTSPIVYDSDIDIIHKPHERHSKRDFATIQKVISKGGRLSANLTTMYAKELFISGDDDDFNTAHDYFKEIADGQDATVDEINQAAAILVHCALINNNLKEMFTYSLKNMVTSPCAEICNDIGEFYMKEGDYSEAYIWFYNAIYEASAILSLNHSRIIPLKNIVKCCEKLGDVIKAKEFLEKLEEINKER